MRNAPGKPLCPPRPPRPDEFSVGSPRPDEFSVGSPRPDEFSLRLFVSSSSFLPGTFPPELSRRPGAPSRRRRPSLANYGRRRRGGAPGPLISSRAEAEVSVLLSCCLAVLLSCCLAVLLSCSSSSRRGVGPVERARAVLLLTLGSGRSPGCAICVICGFLVLLSLTPGCGRQPALWFLVLLVFFVLMPGTG